MTKRSGTPEAIIDERTPHGRRGVQWDDARGADYTVRATGARRLETYRTSNRYVSLRARVVFVDLRHLSSTSCIWGFWSPLTFVCPTYTRLPCWVCDSYHVLKRGPPECGTMTFFIGRRLLLVAGSVFHCASIPQAQQVPPSETSRQELAAMIFEGVGARRLCDTGNAAPSDRHHRNHPPWCQVLGFTRKRSLSQMKLQSVARWCSQHTLFFALTSQRFVTLGNSLTDFSLFSGAARWRHGCAFYRHY